MKTSIGVNGSVRQWRQYPTYKDSGVQWLEQIPSHWQAKRAEYVCDLFVGFPFPSEHFSHEPNGIRLLRGDNVTTDSVRWGDKSRFWPHDATLLGRYFLEANDIVIGMDGSKVGKNYALIDATDLPILLVQRVARLRAATEMHPSFLYRCIANSRFHAHVDYHRTDPAIPHITLKDIGTYIICVPPTDEQRRIVAFLDRETAKIDALIAKKERLIELLQEKRTALISQAVTEGLEPNVLMKDSGVAWLGKIPSQWQAKRVEYVCDLFVGFPFPSERFSHEPNGIRLLRGDNVTTDSVRWGDKARFWPHETTPYYRYFLKANDIVIGMDGSKVGKNYALIDATDLPILLVQRVARLRAATEMHPSFLYRCIANSRFHAHVDYHRTDPAIPHITLKDIGTYIICVPPTDEQRRIVAFLDRETAKIDALIALVREAIDKLHEYRTALISAAVTGKIDVREEVA